MATGKFCSHPLMEKKESKSNQPEPRCSATLIMTGGMSIKTIRPGEGDGNPLQYSCLENPMDREAWQATVHGVTRVGHD